MSRTTFLPTLLAATFLGPAAWGQTQHADATLFTRIDGDEVRVAIEVELDFGWHLYHNDKGPADAVGLATEVQLSGDGIEWSEVRFPEPVRFEQPGIGQGGADTWIWGHEYDLVLYAAGRLLEGADETSIEAVLSGQTCQDSGQCVPYGQTLSSDGEGEDELFDDFPADLAPPGGGAPDDGRPDGEIEGWGQRDAGRAEATLYARVEGDALRAVIEVEIDRGWHLYHDELGPPEAVGMPTTVELGGLGIEWSEVRFPEPERGEQYGIGPGGSDTWIWEHHGNIELHAAGTLWPDASVEDAIALLTGLTCEASGQCVPFSASVAYEGEGPDELFADFPADLVGPVLGMAEEPLAEPGPAPEEEDEDDGLLRFILAAIGWGLFALMMPCTYPMIPITISFFTKQAEARGGNVLPLSLAYGLGIVVVFVLIGLVIGPPIVAFAQHPATNIIIGLVFLIFALALFGVITLNPPRFLMNAAGQASMVGGYGGVFLMGTAFVVTSFTCTAPFVGALLSVGASSGDLGRVAIGMAVFGATMATPFVFLSLLPGKVQSMPKAGEWMHVLKVFLGFVEVAAALKFLSNADLVLGWEIISREFFLVSWGVTFLFAGIFLLGFFHLEGESGGSISPKRMLGALCVLMFSSYCFYGLGHKLDFVMDALVPPYSSRIYASADGEGGAEQSGHQIIEDDYDAALALARSQDKALLVNFTGHT